MAYGPARVLAENASNVVTWKQYGAIGDGVADDAAAINACMLAADQNGWEVYASSPDVAYRITAPIDIYDGTVLRGDNKVRTKIQCERSNAINCADSEDAGEGYTSDWELRDLLFVGDDDTATDGDDHIGLHARRSIRFLVENCEFRGFTDACVIDGRKNDAGTWFGIADGRILNCIFQIDNAAQQKNPTNAYPRYLVEVAAEADGVGGADGVSFYNCRLYAEILTDAALTLGDGVTTVFDFGAIKSGKELTEPAHMVVEHVAAPLGGRTQLTPGVEYSVDLTDPNAPSFDFSGGTSPLGAPAGIVLLSGTGDGATKAFRLDYRPSYPNSDSVRAVKADVGGVTATPGDDYLIVDGNNRNYAAAADAAADTLTIDATEIGEFAVGRLVRVSSDGTLPGGLAAATDYYVTAIDTGAGAFKLAATYADAVSGAPTTIDLTDAGTGAHEVSIEHAIEFASAPANAAAIDVDDMNLRFRWVDPNAEACAKLCRGAQRISFFSCAFGGGRYGVDFDHARRCLIVDAYFQIHENGVRFGRDAQQNEVVGFAARTDATIIGAFALDESLASTNAFDEFFAAGATVKNYLYVKEAYDEETASAGMLRKNQDIVSLEALEAGGQLQMKVGGNPSYVFSASADRTSIYDAAGVESWRNDSGGTLMPRGAGQQVGNSAFPVAAFVGDAVHLTEGVSEPPLKPGVAQLYVDTADGALKVKFADTTIKTIATNP